MARLRYVSALDRRVIRCPHCKNDDSMMITLATGNEPIFTYMAKGGQLYRNTVLFCGVCSNDFKVDQIQQS